MTSEELVSRAVKRKGTVAIGDLVALGLSRPTLYRALKALEQRGEAIRLRRGVYTFRADHAEGSSWTLALHQHPKGILCLLSALQFHGLTTQSPSTVWLALPKGSRPPGSTYPPIKAVYVSGDAFSAGVERHKRPEGAVRVYSVAKTVADCFKFRNRIGLDVALEALREGWAQRRFTLNQLDAMARVCRVQAVMRPYIEALVA